MRTQKQKIAAAKRIIKLYSKAKQYDILFRQSLFIDGVNQARLTCESIQSKIDLLYSFIALNDSTTKFKKPKAICYWVEGPNVWQYVPIQDTSIFQYAEKDGEVYSRKGEYQAGYYMWSKWVLDTEVELDSSLKSDCEGLYINWRVR